MSPQLCEFCGPVDDQVHDGVELGFAEEEQVGGLLLLLGGLRDAQGFQEGGSEPPAVLAPQLGTCLEPAGEQLQDLLGAGGAVGLGYGLGEFDAGGALPGLGGDACPAHTTVGGVLGGSGVVTVDVGRWDGLHDAQVEVQTLTHGVLRKSGWWTGQGLFCVGLGVLPSRFRQFMYWPPQRRRIRGRRTGSSQWHRSKKSLV